MKSRRWFLGAMVTVCCVGCEPKPLPKPKGVTSASLSGDDLLKHVDRELDFGFYRRRLNTKDHAAWQIIHGVLPYEKATEIEADGKVVRAIDYAMSGGAMNGWSLERGDLLDEKTGRYGVRGLLQLGTKIGQGHPDQWLGYLQDCDVKLEDKVTIGTDHYTVADWVEQIERDIHRNPTKEYSWTLMALSKYRPSTHQWKASDGSEWSIEKLLESEIKAGVESVACGGTHRMVGIAHAYNRRKAAGEKIADVWLDAEKLVNKCKAACSEYRNDDGSLSSNFFLRGGMAGEIGTKLHATGHQFEFLMVSMNDAEIKEQWVRGTAFNLTETLRKTNQVPLECGALYHALRGLALYRKRVWGEKKYDTATA